MKNSEIKSRYEATMSAIDGIKKDETPYMYATQQKYIPNIGYIHQLDIPGLLKATSFLNKLSENQFSAECEELGLNPTEIPLTETDSFLNFKISAWKQDIKTRLSELRAESRMQNLVNDASILHRHLDETSIKEMDLAKLSNEKV